MAVSFDAVMAVNIALITEIEYVNDRQVLALCGVMFDGLCYVMHKLGNWNLRQHFALFVTLEGNYGTGSHAWQLHTKCMVARVLG